MINVIEVPSVLQIAVITFAVLNWNIFLISDFQIMINNFLVSKEFWLFVVSKFISLLSLGLQSWTLKIPITKSSTSLNESSWAVLSLYCWLNEWMSFFLVQHLAKSPYCKTNYCNFYPMLGNYLHYVSQNWIFILWWLYILDIGLGIY